MKNVFYDGDGPVGEYLRNNYFLDYDYKGILLEVGGGHPEQYSFSKHFTDNGWRSIIFEPNPKYAQMHRDLGNEIYQVAVSTKDEENVDFQILTKFGDFEMSGSALSVKYQNEFSPGTTVSSIKVDVITLNTFFENNNLKEVDIISVDTEGWELEVMEGFDTSKYYSKFVVLENLKYSPKYNKSMREKGYKLLTNIGINYIYEFVEK